MKYVAIGTDVLMSAFVGGTSEGERSASHHLLRAVAEGVLVVAGVVEVEVDGTVNPA